MKKEPGVEVEVVNGNHGELTVSVAGEVVAQKEGDTLPDANAVLAALRKTASGAAV